MFLYMYLQRQYCLIFNFDLCCPRYDASGLTLSSVRDQSLLSYLLLRTAVHMIYHTAVLCVAVSIYMWASHIGVVCWFWGFRLFSFQYNSGGNARNSRDAQQQYNTVVAVQQQQFQGRLCAYCTYTVTHTLLLLYITAAAVLHQFQFQIARDNVRPRYSTTYDMICALLLSVWCIIGVVVNDFVLYTSEAYSYTEYCCTCTTPY